VIPFHDGAIRFWKEAGLWKPEHQAHNDKLIQRQKVLAAAWAEVKKSSLDDKAFVTVWQKRRAAALTQAGFDPVQTTGELGPRRVRRRRRRGAERGVALQVAPPCLAGGADRARHKRDRPRAQPAPQPRLLRRQDRPRQRVPVLAGRAAGGQRLPADSGGQAGAPRRRAVVRRAAVRAVLRRVRATTRSTRQRIVEEGWEYKAPREAIWVAYVGWLLLLEATRRAGGSAVFVVVAVFSLYPVFAATCPGRSRGCRATCAPPPAITSPPAKA
jgi:hypothetical protein